MSKDYQRIMAAEAAIAKLTVSTDKLKLENSVLTKFIEKKTIELGPDEDERKKKEDTQEFAYQSNCGTET